jgi:ornithine cyclodeaminase
MYRSGEIIGPVDPAPTTKHVRRVDAHLGDIVAGRQAGRQSDDDIVLVNPFGLSIEDIALAASVYREAQRLQLGTRLKR